jgi:hypothetical protein
MLWTRFPFVCLSSVSIFGLLRCNWDKYQHCRLNGDPQSRVRVLYDSPELNALVDQVTRLHEAHLRALGSLSEKERLNAFMLDGFGKSQKKIADDIGKLPGYDAPGQTRFKILYQSNALQYYVKAQFEAPPLEGKVGWVPVGSFDDSRTRMP